jgi:hypothetical protein
VWEDPWIPDLPSFKPQPKDSQTLRQSLVVSQLMNQDKSLWDVEVLKNLFEEVSVQAILDIPRWSTDHPDRWIWVKTSNGAFSVKSAFKEASKEIQPSLVNPVLGKIWKTHLHERLKLLIWRITTGLLLTKDSIARFAPSVNQTCVLCEHHNESIMHLF